MRKILGVLIGLIIGMLVVTLPGNAGVRYPYNGPPLPGDTIVGVTGDKHQGFRVKHYDGSSRRFPPIRMARMECYDGLDSEGRIAYERCMTTVAVEYRYLAEVKRAIIFQRGLVRP